MKWGISKADFPEANSQNSSRTVGHLSPSWLLTTQDMASSTAVSLETAATLASRYFSNT